MPAELSSSASIADRAAATSLVFSAAAYSASSTQWSVPGTRRSTFATGEPGITCAALGSPSPRWSTVAVIFRAARSANAPITSAISLPPWRVRPLCSAASSVAGQSKNGCPSLERLCQSPPAAATRAWCSERSVCEHFTGPQTSTLSIRPARCVSAVNGAPA